MSSYDPAPRPSPPPLPSSRPSFPPPTSSSSSTSSSSPSSSSIPSSPPTSSLPADVDLSVAYPVSPFDSVCLKHIRRYLQGYDRVYTRLLMDYGAERSKMNQQHWERVHRLQQQHVQKLRRLQHEQSVSSGSSRSSKHSEEEESKELDISADAALDAAADGDEEKVAPAKESARARASDADEADAAQLHSELAEMKAELDVYHMACLSDANRRFRSMIIGLTHRLDTFLSTQISPSQLLQELDVQLTVKAANSQRSIECKFSCRCVETFSDLRRRFVHFMREERGDAVLAFTPDSQFLVLNSAVNPACKTDMAHAYAVQPPPQPSKRQQEEQREEERKAAQHADAAHHSTMYAGLTRPLAAFRARATRARAGYAAKVSTKVSSVVEEESSASSTPVGDGASSGRRGSTDLSAAASAAAAPLSSWPPSPSKDRPRPPSSAPPPDTIQPLSMPTFSSTFDAPDSSSSHPPPSAPPPTSSPALPPLLILDEDVAVINFVADFVPHLTVHLLGAVVLVSDQAANLQPKRLWKAPFAAHPPQGKEEGGVRAGGPATRPRSLHALGASASRLPAKLLPHLRQQFAAAPPLPKLPPSLTAFFHRATHTHPHPGPAEPPATPAPAATPTSEASLSTGRETPTAILSAPSRHPSDLSDSFPSPSDTGQSPPQQSFISSAASDQSGSSDDDDSVHHVSISHRESRSVNPIDDDDLDDSMLTNAASLRPPYPTRHPHLRSRNLSHPLAAHPSSGVSSAIFSTPALPPLPPSRYPHLSVDVDGELNERLDSVIPSQSFSVSIPFIDYDQESLLDAEDSRAMEASVAHSERSELERELSALAQPGEDEQEQRPDEEDEEAALHSQGRQARGRRRRGQLDSASVEAEMNGLVHSHSFSQSSSFQSTPPSALPTPSISRPPSATSELLAAGILHLPRHQSNGLPSSLPTSSSPGGDSPFPLPTSPPIAASSLLSPLLRSPSPADAGQPFISQQRMRGGEEAPSDARRESRSSAA